MSWTRALHLTRWAGEDGASALLPVLIRRLVRRTVPSLQSLNFPGWEQSERPGFDGEVEAREGNQYVPAGWSGWELSIQKDVKTKAEADFQKRSEEFSAIEQAKRTFVFVTPQVWRKKDEWATERAMKSQWKSVVVHDANDLEHWLETARDVDAWFARLCGHAPVDVQDLESYWNGLRSIAEYPLSELVFTASRDEEIAAVTKWLGGAPSSFFMRASGLSDGLDFLAALSSRDDQDRLRNGLIVYTVDSWRELSASREPLFLIAAPALELQASDTATAVKAGHFVFLSGPRGNVTSSPSQPLRRQDYYSISQGLIASGFSEPRALQLAKACSGSSSILKRLISRHPDTTFPPWSRDDWRSTLAPFALVGGWAHVDPEPLRRDPELPRIGSGPPIDVLVVSELVGCSRDELGRQVARWQSGNEPLFIRFGDSVLIASREDAWYLLAGATSSEQLKRFRDLAVLVLEEDDPKYELEPDQQWMANLFEKSHSISEDLRRSIVETLALMATYPTADAPATNVSLSATVRSVLERTLPSGAVWKRWASFGDNLMTLAEADPEFFLGRVEADLSSSETQLPKLFQDQSTRLFSGGAHHTHLLWALEGLAWAPEYLRRAVLCLAKLASRDPGGTYANRPSNSLREILLLWLPHTNASVEDRLDALSAIIEVEPAIAWKLLKDLLPVGLSSFSHNTHLPRWRPWADGWSREKVAPDTARYAKAVAELTILAADADARRWSEILDGIMRFSREICERAFAVLDGIADSATPNDPAVVALWTEMGRLVSRHERYADAEWALDKPIRERLGAIRDRLVPADPVLRAQWLFRRRVALPGFDLVKEHEAHERALYDARAAALREILATAGPQGVFRLLELGGDAWTLGWIVGADQLLDWEDAGLPTVLESSAQSFDFAHAYIRSRFQADGWDFVKRLPFARWSTPQIALFARCLRAHDKVWDWLARFDPEVWDAYWRLIPALSIDPSLGEAETAAKAFLRVGRGFSAVQLLHWALERQRDIPSSLIGDALETAGSGHNVESPDEHNDARYAVQGLVKHLQEDASFDRVRLAAIEWKLLALLDSEHGETGPDTLIKAVLSHPGNFVQLLKTTYRGRKDAKDEQLTEQEQLVARQAYKVLEALRELPGTKDDGTVDYEYLREWVDKTRTLAAECDRREVCDLTLGRLIARGTMSFDRDGHGKFEGDGLAPEISAIMEAAGSDHMFGGFINGVLNSRGVVGRDPFAGGDSERGLVDEYRRLAKITHATSPKLATAFREIADHYESYARHEDTWAERARLGR